MYKCADGQGNCCILMTKLMNVIFMPDNCFCSNESILLITITTLNFFVHFSSISSVLNSVPTMLFTDFFIKFESFQNTSERMKTIVSKLLSKYAIIIYLTSTLI